ncbi:hypothetical protein MMF93_20490 [Streptomyces tubbatahanensis]|uniref:Uncharacterized protein n=1 Tax=Streptomyces tubbatahanensis TaxID=2923272 RepID=A0ABY3XVR2_9ACTN|nr:hypothetical protein [Streptomyces tubbatahanensis]UNS98569.1 hypothetical protein MMF93_20490 [Streptomyces tubbatahanensis]
MWKLGDAVRDVRTGAAGTIAQVTGPAPHIYRLAVPVPVGPPLALYRYGDEVRPMPPAVGADAPPCSRYRVEVADGRSYLIDPAGHLVHTADGRAHWPDEPTAQAVADEFNG